MGQLYAAIRPMLEAIKWTRNLNDLLKTYNRDHLTKYLSELLKNEC